MGRAARVLVLAAAFLSIAGSSSPASADDPAPTTLHPVSLAPNEVFAQISEDGAGPDMAYDGTNFMVVWHAGRAVYGALLSTGGTIVGPGVITIESDDGWRPSVAFDGTNYMVFWTQTDGDDSERQIHAVRVSTAGVVLDGQPKVVGVDSKLRRISATFDGTSYLVVWRTAADLIRGARVSTEGAPLDALEGFSIGGGFYPWVESAGGRSLVVWHGQGNDLDIYGALVDNGTPTAPFTIFSGAADQDHVSVATNGTGYAVAFKDARFGNQENFAGTSAVRVGADGTVLDDPPIHVSDLEWRQGSNPTVAWDGADWIVAWPEYHAPVKHRLSDIHARRISTAGALVDLEPIPIVTRNGHQVAPTIGVVGNRYVVALMDRSSPCTYPGICLGLRLFDRVAATDPVPPASGPPHPEGGVWERVGVPHEGPIHSVWAFGDESAFAGTDDNGVDPYPSRLLGWNGTVWSDTGGLPNSRKFGMWGTSPTRLFSAGGCSSLVLWNGVTPRETGCMFGGPANGLWGFGGTSLFVAQVEGGALRSQLLDDDTEENFESWDWHRDTVRPHADNFDVWGSAPDDVYMVGEFGTVGHWDGTNPQSPRDWALVDVPTQQSLNGIWGSCGGDIFAVGDFGTILRYNAGTWSRQGSPTTEHLYAVVGFSGSNVFAVGNNGTILHYDGTTWSPENSGTDNTLEDVAIGESVVWVTGSRDHDWNGVGPGTILRKQLTIADGSAPENPVLFSRYHPSGTWKRDRTVDVSLLGGCDDGRGIDGFSYAFDQSPDTTPPAAKDIEATATGVTSAELADADWYVHLRTVDRAGNWSGTSHLGPFFIDGTPPTNPTLSGEPTPGAWSKASKVKVSWRDEFDARAGVIDYSFSFDHAPATEPDTEPDAEGHVHEVEQQLVDGTWYFHLRTRDGAFNWSAATAHIGPFLLDRANPSQPALSSRSHFTFTPSSDRTVDVEIDGGADDASGADGFSYTWDQSVDTEPDTVKELEESAESLTSPALADGDWWVHVRTADNAGNWSATSTMGPFRIDTVAPETIIGTGPTGVTNDSTPTISFAANEPGSFECRVDEGLFAACGSSHTTAVLTDGSHVFLVRAVDRAGNADASPAARPFTVDTTPPETTLDSGPGGITVDSTPTFTFSAREAAKGFECRLDRGPFAACSSPHTTAPLAAGAHSFEVGATDLAGNVDPSPASQAFTVEAIVRRAAVALSSRTVAITATGFAPIKLGCGSQAACKGVVTLEATVDERALAAAGKRRKVKLGSRSFSIPAGRTRTVPVKLSRRGFRLVQRLGRLRARAVIATRQSGGGKTAFSRPITLKARKR